MPAIYGNSCLSQYVMHPRTCPFLAMASRKSPPANAHRRDSISMTTHVSCDSSPKDSPNHFLVGDVLESRQQSIIGFWADHTKHVGDVIIGTRSVRSMRSHLITNSFRATRYETSQRMPPTTAWNWKKFRENGG